MTQAEYFHDNFVSFALMLSGAPGGGCLRFAGGSFAAASGCESAGENYGVFSGSADAEQLGRCIAFFDERRAAFAAPLFPEAPEGFASVLESRGLVQRHVYTSMILPLGGREDNGALEAVTQDRLQEWEKGVWTAFGGDPDDAAGIAGYARLSDYLAFARGNRAYILFSEGEPAVTALLHESPDTLGLYYFATVPKFRRRGLAKRALTALAAEADRAGKPMTLLATEEGFLAYDAFGFSTIDRVPMFSASSDL